MSGSETKPPHPGPWMLTSIPNGFHRGDLDAAQLRASLYEGWEPFAVAEGRIWLRKKGEPLKP